MLRNAIFILCVGMVAACSDSSDPDVGLVVRSDDGVELGRVIAIERDGEGRIVAAEIAGLEPADAPVPTEELLAEDERFWVRASASAQTGGAFTALR